MAVIAASARYGTAVYGVSLYGVVDISATLTGVEATGAVGTVTVAVNVPVTGNQLTQNFSPEYDLTLTGALPAGQISGTFTNRTQSIVFAGEVQLPSSFTQTECLWEHGASGTGAWLGVSKILDTYYLRFRASEGDSAVQDNTPGDICLQNVAISSIPEFDGNTHTVVFELKPSAPSRIQLWIDGREVINTEKATAMEGGIWAGSGVGGWGAGFSGIAGGTAVTDSGTTQYQAATAWSGTIASPLRYYANQLADFGTGAVNTVTVNVAENLNSVFATGQVTAVTPVVNIEVPITGVEGTGQVSAVQANTGAGLNGVEGTGAIGTLEHSNTKTLTGVEGTGEVESVVIGGFEIDIAEIITIGVEGTGAVSAVQTNTGAGLNGVEATGNIGTLEHSNTKTLTGVEGTGQVKSVVIGAFEIDITERITVGVEGTGAVSAVQANPGAGLESVEATGSIGTLEHSNTKTLTGVAGTFANPAVGVGASETVESVFATGAVNDNFTHSNVTGIDSVIATGQAGQTTETGVLFNFESVKDQYSRRRTILIPRAA